MPVLLQQGGASRRRTKRDDRLFTAHWQNPEEREKAGGDAVRGEAVGVCPSAALVCGPRGGNQGCSLNNRLPSGQDLSLVCGAGDGGTPYRRCRKEQGLLAKVFKLLGNSGYGKLIEALERQTNVIYTEDEKVVDRALRSAYFSDLDELGKAYKLESRKPRITLRRPFQIGIAMYQPAKLRMLEFYYDFLDRYFERRDFELIQMNTDNNYMAISADSLEEIVRPELRTDFEAKRKEWLAWGKWSGRTPGLFKLKCEGSRMIALCLKCYFIDEQDNEKKKFSMKGMSKRQNDITWQHFKASLKGSKDLATNRGFRMIDGRMVSYEQQKLGLSAYYDKRWVLEDVIHTEIRSSYTVS